MISIHSMLSLVLLILQSLIGILAYDQKILSINSKNQPRKVAIIGAGPGGSSAAYYLNKFTNNSDIYNVTIFERLGRVGGRTTVVYAYDNTSFPIELGASIYVGANKILSKAAKDFSLETRTGPGAKPEKHYKPTEDNNDLIGIWDGEGFVFQFKAGPGASSWITGLRFLYKYGVSSVRTVRLTRALVGNFLKYYYNQYFPFSSLQSLNDKTGFLSYTNVTGAEYLKNNKVSDSFSHDIIQSLTRANYASNLLQIHGLETLVSVAAEDTYQIVGGNWKIFKSFIDASGATLKLNTKVDFITKNADNGARWQLCYTLVDNTTAIDSFDEVIIAAPFHQTDIFEKPVGNQSIFDTIPYTEYVTLHVTLFTSKQRLSKKYFKISKNKKVPTSILTTTSEEKSFSPPFYSISTLYYIPETDEYVYKIFSSNKLSEQFIETELLEDSGNNLGRVSWIHRKTWKSYPKLPPTAEFLPFKLEAGLWYLNTMETFISTMETSALAGANVAALLAKGHNTTEISIP